MALSWDLSEIEDYKNLCWIKTEPLPSEGEVETDEDGKVERINPVTETLIFGTISCGMGKITDKNASEFYARMKIMEKLVGGAFVRKDNEDYFLQPEDVIAHIGLVTNASYKDQTRAQFFKQISSTMDSYKFAVAQEQKEVAA